ncbi:hypothetical protein [Paenibacillus brevis]|uniref:Uncharacterized protein n=1 Tax=Paenibacillus brevis TaxID=2841508 RepID=A0ABS6FX25_9BACL|nr:hypothetical protein [Paenibacillus brevis]MBU5674796.1 hypothetical protein [Paenibacillus brevis]
MQFVWSRHKVHCNELAVYGTYQQDMRASLGQSALMAACPIRFTHRHNGSLGVAGSR